MHSQLLRNLRLNPQTAFSDPIRAGWTIQDEHFRKRVNCGVAAMWSGAGKNMFCFYY